MNKVFLSFADSRMHRSSTRISRQAKELNLYDQIITTDENSLNAEFTNKFIEKLIPGSRGFGHWCWKPQIILQTLRNMEDGDILQYTDVGCHLNPQGKARLLEYFEMADKSESGILAFQAKPPEFPFIHDGRPLLDLSDFKWIKGDLLDYFSVRNYSAITNSPSIGAGIVFIKKCPASIKIIQQWLDVFSTNFSLLDDSPSKSENLPGFIEHRHDQAIFSLLCKLNNIKTISAYEYWYPKKNSSKPDWRALNRFPIHAKRDKDLGPKEKTTQTIKKVISKINQYISLARKKWP